MSAAFWTCAIITTASAFTSAGFSLAGLRGAGEAGDARIASLYAAARSLPLAVVSLAALFAGSHEWLGAVAVTMILVQALDAYVGFEQRDIPKTAGPIFLSLLNLGSLIVLVAS
jgi:hypothetical protein